MHIERQNPSNINYVPDQLEIEKWVKTALSLASERIPVSRQALTIRFVDEHESAALNKNFRNRQGPTNVLAFEDNPLGELEADSLGDLAICVSVVIQEAKQQNKTPLAHFAHMVIHGLLHLIGYDHQEKQAATVMESLETKIMLELGFDPPYCNG